MDLLDLGSFLSILYASIIPYFLAYKLFPSKRSFAYLSTILGTMLLIHSIHHLGEFMGNAFLEDVFGLASAVMAVFLGITYSYLRGRVQ